MFDKKTLPVVWIGSLFLVIFSGCASITGQPLAAERYIACPQDSVWTAALEVLSSYPVTVKDKSKGLIETDWKIQPTSGRSYGVFGRQGLGDKERSRLTVSLKPLSEGVVALTVTERRHHWGFRGGGRIYDWVPVEPSQAAMNDVMNQLTAQLDKEGCIVES